MNEKQLKFKLYRNGKHVGWQWETDSRGMGGIRILQMRLGCEWVDVIHHPHHYIEHDHKEQFTGYHDMHGEEIYFGDKLRWSNNKAWHCFGTYEVKLQDGIVCAIRKKQEDIECRFFKEMRLN